MASQNKTSKMKKSLDKDFYKNFKDEEFQKSYNEAFAIAIKDVKELSEQLLNQAENTLEGEMEEKEQEKHEIQKLEQEIKNKLLKEESDFEIMQMKAIKNIQSFYQNSINELSSDREDKKTMEKITSTVKDLNLDFENSDGAYFSAINDLINTVILPVIKKVNQGVQVNQVMKKTEESVTPSAKKLNVVVSTLAPYMKEYWTNFPASKNVQSQFTKFLIAVGNSDNFDTQMLAKNLAENFFDRTVSQDASAVIELDKTYGYKINYPQLIGDVFKINSSLPAKEFKEIINHFSASLSFFEKFAKMDLPLEHRSELARSLIDTNTIGGKEKISILSSIYKGDTIDCTIAMDFIISQLALDYKLQAGVRPKLAEIIEQTYGFKINEEKWVKNPYKVSNENSPQWAKWVTNFKWVADSKFDIDYESIVQHTKLLECTVKEMEAMSRDKAMYNAVIENIILTLNKNDLGISSARFAKIFKTFAHEDSLGVKDKLNYDYWNILYTIGRNSIFNSKKGENEKSNVALQEIFNSLKNKNLTKNATYTALALIHQGTEKITNESKEEMAALAKETLYGCIKHEDFSTMLEHLEKMSSTNHTFWSGASRETLSKKISGLAALNAYLEGGLEANIINSTSPWWWGSADTDKRSLLVQTNIDSIYLIKEMMKGGEAQYLNDKNLARLYLGELIVESHKVIEKMTPTIAAKYGPNIMPMLNVICQTWPELANHLWKHPITTSRGNVYYCVGDVLEKEWGIIDKRYLNSETLVNRLYEQNVGALPEVSKPGFFKGWFSKKMTFEEKLVKIAPWRTCVASLGINKNGAWTEIININEHNNKNTKMSDSYKAIVEFLEGVQHNEEFLNGVSVGVKIKTQSLLLEVTSLAQLIKETNIELDMMDGIQVKQIIGHCRESMQAFIDGKSSIETLKGLKKNDAEETATLNKSISFLEREYSDQLTILNGQLEKIQNLIYSKIQGSMLKTSLVQSTFLKNKFNQSKDSIEAVPASVGDDEANAIVPHTQIINKIQANRPATLEVIEEPSKTMAVNSKTKITKF